MQRLPEQDIYIYKTPGEEVYKILVGDLDGKRLKVLSKVETSNGAVSYKIFSEDAHKNMETLSEGKGTAADFEEELTRLEQQLLKPLGEGWREIQPKYISNLDPAHPCPGHQGKTTRS